MNIINQFRKFTLKQILWVINICSVAVIVYLLILVIQINSLTKDQFVICRNYQLTSRLTHELRQTSEDLSKLSRLFVVTQDPKFEEYYNNVLSIKNGEKKRPKDYYRPYWDFVIANDKKPRPEGNRIIPMRKLMIESGFNEKEVEKLDEALNLSDAVVFIENKAINTLKETIAVEKKQIASLIKSPVLQDSTSLTGDTINETAGIDSATISLNDSTYHYAGVVDSVSANFQTPIEESNQEQALQSLFDDEYLKAKGKFNTPVDELFVMLDKKMNDSIDRFNKKMHRKILSIIILIVFILLFVFGINFISNEMMLKRFNKIHKNLQLLSKGILPKEKLDIKGQSEIDLVSGTLNKYVEKLEETALFATRIGKGELDAGYTPSSEEDILGNSLIEMRNSLVEASKEEEKRKLEDANRNWATQGIAKFNDILRQNYENLSELAYNIIKNLVDYLKANQSGIFLLNDDNTNDKYLEMMASYAFNRRKYIKKKILLGEGLIGTCALEKRTIFLTTLPDNYINITSGLGKANPRCLLIVPMVIENNTLGIIELASFSKLQPFEVEFVEKVAETVASTMSSVKINERTAKLLDQSQQQAEAMVAQEEEMRQNMEELQATQEEATRKEEESTNFIETVNEMTLRADINIDGTIRFLNSKLVDLIGTSQDEIIGGNILDFITDELKIKFQTIWNDIATGKTKYEGVQNFETSSGKFNLISSFSAVYDRDGNPSKVLFLGFDISSIFNSNIKQ